MPPARATMKDVAALAGVSPKTVSNVVTGSASVSPETRERVDEAMRRLDFVPNLSARGLRNGRSGVIAVALPDLGTAYSAEMLHHLVEAAHAHGLAVQVEETAAEPRRELELVSRARAHLMDGLILNPVRLEDSVVQRADDLPPIVLLGEVEQHRADRVLVDSAAAAAEVTRHVLSRGARRVAVIGADDEPGSRTATARVRLEGVRSALAEAGLAHDPRLTSGPATWTSASGAEAMRAVLARHVPFDAVIAFTDSLALGALGALAEAGLRVPDDVLVCGFDDVEAARYARPSLTTVSFDRRAFAAEAVRLLVSRIADRAQPARAVVVPHTVVVRASTGG